MKSGLLRTAIIYVVLILCIIQVVPTVGWYSLSETERGARLKQWKDEDLARQSEVPSFFGNIKHSVTRWSEFDESKSITLGLDLVGGVSVVMGLDFDSLEDSVHKQYEDAGYPEAEIRKMIQQNMVNNVRNRVNQFEAKEPLIQALGDSQIQVQLPGEKDVDRALKLIKQTAKMDFYLVAGNQETTQAFRAVSQKYPRFGELVSAGLSGFYSTDAENFETVAGMAARAQEEGLLPEGKMIAFSKPPKAYAQNRTYDLYLLNVDPDMPGAGLQEAFAGPNQDSGGGNWMVNFRFSSEEGQKLGQLTENNIGVPMAIVVDGNVMSAPTIRGKITVNGQITGNFTSEEATDLAIALNSGALEVDLVEDYTGVVSATLGADSIHKGIYSAGIGLALVILFMLVYYHLSGLVATLSLVYSALLILAALAYFGATVTLPGVAGLILTIGMAVDANVLIFERIREEVRNGKSLLASIESGYETATITILDANVTTLIAAAALMEFGSGPIESFAVTLSIGVVASVFAALIVTRALLDFFTKAKVMGKLTMMNIIKPDSKIDFMSQRRIAVVLSLVAIIIGMGYFLANYEKQFGVDFKTGTNMVISLTADGKIEDDAVRNTLAAAGYGTSTVQRYAESEAEAEGNFFNIRVGEVTDPSDSGMENTVSAHIQKALLALTNDPSFDPAMVPEGTQHPVHLERVETVGPAVGSKLRSDAYKAICTALLLIVAYLWVRFELRFAVGAVVALVHDVLITAGLFALTGREITLPVIAALLTIIGYSLNDTIIVFDRVREDMRLYRGRNMPFVDILNIGINHTLSRTLLTSSTTIIVVIILFFFGGTAIEDFAFALIVGVGVGTYSSIFVASPIVYLWHVIQNRHDSDNDAAGKAKGKSKAKAKSKTKSVTA